MLETYSTPADCESGWESLRDDLMRSLLHDKVEDLTVQLIPETYFTADGCVVTKKTLATKSL
jgi:hypothetical protein